VALAEARSARRHAVLLHLVRLLRQSRWQRRQPCP
jgi:hypothetical protein